MAYQAKNKNLPPVDTDVQLPAAIRAAAAKANALHQQEYETPTPPAAQEDNGQERKPEETVPPAKAEEVKPADEKVPATPSGDENWEHNYKSLKGRYDKDQATIQSLTRDLADMRATIAGLQRQPPAPVERTNENTFKKLTKEEREAYGEDFIDVSARAAEEKLLPEIENLRRQIVELGGKVETTAATTHQNQTTVMWGKLDSALPDWRKINRDPDFLKWVNLRDPLSGAIRIDMMNAAYRAGEADRVLNFFNGFLRDEAVVEPVTTNKQEVTPQGKVPLESLAAPGRAKASAAPTPPDEKETITRAQIANFYRRVNQGYYRGNEAEKDRLEAMIFDAEREGRVV